MKGTTTDFSDAPNVAVIASRRVIYEHDWIAYVSHDAEDGAWQFVGSTPGASQECDAVVVSLKNILTIDGTIHELADLPIGWHAWRTAKDAPWSREKEET
ncbi:hypothetical protein PQR14_04545 [Paraburkholderia bryophila]|uniref:hypothetical protein n=1 Tax=Paraburkholderia bryophila TaxID=420952 RepID=UPI0038BAC3E5